MNSDDNVNDNYAGDKRPCSICGECVDCGAIPKPFVIYKGRPAHWHCIDNIQHPKPTNRVWAFLDKHAGKSLIVQAIILYMQIPHMLWTADLAFLEQKLIAGINTPLDFFLYGIDLLEFAAIGGITMTLIARYKTRGRIL